MGMYNSDNFETRYATLSPKSGNDYFGTWQINRARYAKDKVAISFVPHRYWMKTRACDVLEAVCNHRAKHSSREKAYIVSIAQAEKFLKALVE